LNPGKNNSAKKSVLISRKGKTKCKSLTQSSIWLKTKASPFTLVKGLLEVKRVVSRETETVKRAFTSVEQVSTKFSVSHMLSKYSDCNIIR